jgi:arylsulfatase A-like enzyme
VVALLVLLHYLSALVSVVARKWSPSACRACGGVILAIVSVCGYLWQQRGLTGQAAVRTDPRPNILILASDSLRADHLSVNGYHRPTSPNIDALAARPGAVNFSKCFTPIASTLESCTSLMTGQYPHTHGLQHMFPNKTQVEHMQANSPTLAAQLQSSGYSARAMGDWCGAVYDLLHLGFKERDVSTYDNFQVYMTQAAYLTHAVLPLFFDNEVGHSLFPDLRSCAMLVTPEVVTQRLKRSLTSAAAEQKPFFIKAFYSTTHLPYTVDPPWSKKFTDPEYRGHNNGKVQFDLGAFIADVDSAAKLRETQDSEIQQIIGLYDGCVAKFDATVGEIVAHLEKTGLLRNTIVIVTSDHGDGLFEPGCSLGHGLTFNGGDQDTNIPAVFYIPGRNTPPQKVEQIIRTIDFAPTLLDYAGLPRDSRMDGISVRPLLEGKKLSKNPAYYGETSYLFCKRQIPNEEPLFIPAMEDTTFVDPSFSFHFVLKDAYQDKVLQTKERCVRTQDWKLVFTPGKYYDIWRLFHLPSDPRCQKPLQLLRPEVAAPMKKALLTWMREKREMSIGEIFPEGEPSPQGLSLR